MSDEQDDIIPVAIIGAGFSGIAMAIQLQKFGLGPFVILEKAQEIGGTWRDNRYPGVGCDVPSALYSYSFYQKPDWSYQYAKGGEIQNYLLDCVDSFGVRPFIRFGVDVTGLRFDEDAKVWHLNVKDGPNLKAAVVISAVGPFGKPSTPSFKGQDDFAGKTLHSAHWDQGFDPRGKKIAVIGTGASGIQLVPELAKTAQEIVVFQRTPPWVLPKPDFEISERWHKRFRRFPWILKLRRYALYWFMETAVLVIVKNIKFLRMRAQGIALMHLKKDSPKETWDQLIPKYQMGCKRILVSNDWYPTLAKDHVRLVDTGIRQFESKGIRDGEDNLHEVDAVVYATGYQVPTTGVAVDAEVGGGKRLNDAWSKGTSAFKGISVSGFPNFFILVGPNTGPGHTSVLVFMERQVRHVIDALRAMKRRSARSIEVKKSVHDRYQSSLDRKMEGTVWLSGCNSWYLSPEGKNTSLYPGFSFEYCLKSKFRARHYKMD